MDPRKDISIHAPREGSDLWVAQAINDVVISIHAPREGSDRPLVSGVDRAMIISIHAPREGSDLVAGHRAPHNGISIHAPREGSDKAGRPTGHGRAEFLSTLPARGATEPEQQEPEP